MEYKEITLASALDVQLPNESFNLFGRLHVDHIDDKWSYEIELFDIIESMVFPEENYDLTDIQKKGFALGAYQNGLCVGLAIYEYNWNKYIYLVDLKVKREFRQKGIAAGLIEEEKKYAVKRGYQGLYTVAQDNNLAACQFYLKQGFEIGGFNTKEYSHTQQAGKADIYFYLDI